MVQEQRHVEIKNFIPTICMQGEILKLSATHTHTSKLTKPKQTDVRTTEDPNRSQNNPNVKHGRHVGIQTDITGLKNWHFCQKWHHGAQPRVVLSTMVLTMAQGFCKYTTLGRSTNGEFHILFPLRFLLETVLLF